MVKFSKLGYFKDDADLFVVYNCSHTSTKDRD